LPASEQLSNVSEETEMNPNLNELHSLDSPHQIDEAIQDQGRDLHELLRIFKQANLEPLSSFILQTPKNKCKQREESDIEVLPTSKK
jgi:hypothetical protein